MGVAEMFKAWALAALVARAQKDSARVSNKYRHLSEHLSACLHKVHTEVSIHIVLHAWAKAVTRPGILRPIPARPNGLRPLGTVGAAGAFSLSPISGGQGLGSLAPLD